MNTHTPLRTHRSTHFDPPHAYTLACHPTDVLVQTHSDRRATSHTPTPTPTLMHSHLHMHTPAHTHPMSTHTASAGRETWRAILFLHLTLPPEFVL